MPIPQSETEQPIRIRPRERLKIRVAHHEDPLRIRVKRKERMSPIRRLAVAGSIVLAAITSGVAIGSLSVLALDEILNANQSGEIIPTPEPVQHLDPVVPPTEWLTPEQEAQAAAAEVLLAMDGAIDENNGFGCNGTSVIADNIRVIWTARHCLYSENSKNPRRNIRFSTDLGHSWNNATAISPWTEHDFGVLYYDPRLLLPTVQVEKHPTFFRGQSLFISPLHSTSNGFGPSLVSVVALGWDKPDQTLLFAQPIMNGNTKTELGPGTSGSCIYTNALKCVLINITEAPVRTYKPFRDYTVRFGFDPNSFIFADQGSTPQ